MEEEWEADIYLEDVHFVHNRWTTSAGQHGLYLCADFHLKGTLQFVKDKLRDLTSREVEKMTINTLIGTCKDLPDWTEKRATRLFLGHVEGYTMNRIVKVKETDVKFQLDRKDTWPRTNIVLQKHFWASATADVIIPNQPEATTFTLVLLPVAGSTAVLLSNECVENFGRSGVTLRNVELRAFFRGIPNIESFQLTASMDILDKTIRLSGYYNDDGKYSLMCEGEVESAEELWEFSEEFLGIKVDRNKVKEVKNVEWFGVSVSLCIIFSIFIDTL